MLYGEYFEPSYNHHYSFQSTYHAHSHWRQPVRVGNYVLTCSSFSCRPKDIEPNLDFGIYLSKVWDSYISPIWTSGAYLKSVAEVRGYPAMIVDWPDGSAVSAEMIKRLVNIALSKLRHGKSVDIGCWGGHGRTGTLLACIIARVEHLPAKAAIEAVRQRYCEHAIESKTQEEAVGKYVRIMGVKIRRK
jgi:protein-tyrosine phosphatase